ncbi:hypothetical protein T484DRAFT_1878316 [Baffinella frigidus]|nr:hypothetical protein T484DRAFT_1878316 [Cryptophyta sp. CCMP2293]
MFNLGVRYYSGFGMKVRSSAVKLNKHFSLIESGATLHAFPDEAGGKEKGGGEKGWEGKKPDAPPQLPRRGSWDSPKMWGEERTDGEPDAKAALEWFRRAAELGHAKAAFNLSRLLRRARPPDLAAADLLLRRAADLGYVFRPY